MAFQENLNASVYMFSFSEVMDQMFLKVWGTMQDSFRATLGVASVSVSGVARIAGLEMPPPHHHHHLGFFPSVLI